MIIDVRDKDKITKKTITNKRQIIGQVRWCNVKQEYRRSRGDRRCQIVQKEQKPLELSKLFMISP